MNSNLICNDDEEEKSITNNQYLYQNYITLDEKEKKYKLLSEKINELHNIKLNNPNKINTLEYNINKINADIKNNISNYIEKTKYLEKKLESMQNLHLLRKQIQINNKKNIDKEFASILFEFENKIEQHKSYMTEKINNEFVNLEKHLYQVIQNKKEINNEIYQQIEKLKKIVENEIPRLYSESNDLNYKNNNNIQIMQNMINEEVNNTKNIIINNSKKIKENEENFRQEINNQMEIVNKNINNNKKLEKKNEEDMLEKISDFLKKIKEGIS